MSLRYQSDHEPISSKSILHLLNFLVGMALLFALSPSGADAKPLENKKTYMDCRTSSPIYKRVVLKAKKAEGQLKDIEVILVDKKGKSSIYSSHEVLDQRYIDPAALDKRHILIVGQNKTTQKAPGLFENAAAVSLFQAANESEDMSCLEVAHKAGITGQEIRVKVGNPSWLNELKYQKFSGTLHHKNKLVQLTCFSPMVPKEKNCFITDSEKSVSQPDPLSF